MPFRYCVRLDSYSKVGLGRPEDRAWSDQLFSGKVPGSNSDPEGNQPGPTELPREFSIIRRPGPVGDPRINIFSLHS